MGIFALYSATNFGVCGGAIKSGKNIASVIARDYLFVAARLGL